LATAGVPGAGHKEGGHVPLAADSAGSSLLSYLPIILIIAAMYFLLIRPQSRRRREAAQMQAQLGPGDEVQTVGGLFGRIDSVDDEAVVLEAAPGVKLRYLRGAIARVVSRGSSESDDTDASKEIE
jgi:preprotein translocase subunit YajC